MLSKLLMVIISSNNINFSLHNIPSHSILTSLMQEYQAGKNPVITYKYFGLTRNQKPICAICVEVLSILLLSVYHLIFAFSIMWVNCGKILCGIGLKFQFLWAIQNQDNLCLILQWVKRSCVTIAEKNFINKS